VLSGPFRLRIPAEFAVRAPLDTEGSGLRLMPNSAMVLLRALETLDQRVISVNWVSKRSLAGVISLSGVLNYFR